MTKAELRAKKLNDRNTADTVQKARHDTAIYNHLISSSEYLGSKTILCYVSTNFEIDTINFLNFALLDNKNIFVPKCDENYNIKFYNITALSQLSVGKYSILEPDLSRPQLLDATDALCIVPGLCFDSTGYRLGYGKGYYDRFLKDFNGKSIGLCYSYNVEPSIPHDKYDVKTDLVLTENGFL